MKLTAGWISTLALAAATVESISTQIGQRCPVLASMTTTGAVEEVYARMLLIAAACVAATSAAVSIPGIFSVITDPGLKPSPALYGVGSIPAPSLLVGIARARKSIRRPV